MAALITAGAEVDKANGSGDTPLIFASKNSDEAIVALLITAGAEVDKASSSGSTPSLRRRHSQVLHL